MLNLTKRMNFTQFLTQTCSENNSSDHLHTELVQKKFNMGTLRLDNHHQLFWQLIDRSVQCVFLSLSSDSQHLSYGVCLEVRGEIIRTILCCIVYDSCPQSYKHT